MPKNEKEFPAGHLRDEFNRQQKDAREEVGEQIAAPIDALDPNKLDVSKVDNEIARWVSIAGGNIPVSNMREGYRYIWVTIPDGYRESGAVSNIRQMEASLRSRGYFPVTDAHDTVSDLRLSDLHKRVAWEHRGEGHTVGNTMRGIGDVVLFAIKQEHYDEIMRKDREKRLRAMGIETDPNAIPRQFRNRVFDLNDPRMAKVYGKDAMESVTFSAGFAQPNGGK